MLPIVELRGGIPVGLYHDMPWPEVYLICVIGNMLPVPLVILFVRRIFAFFKRFSLTRSLFEKWETKIRQKSGKVVKYEVLGLILFVAVPLPGTGAWTGAMIAGFLDLRMQTALPAIFAGVMIAGALVTLASFGVVGALNWVL